LTYKLLFVVFHDSSKRIRVNPMLVRQFMAKDVFTLTPDQTCIEALHAMRGKHIRRAPVMKANKMVGIISERDLLHILPGTIGQASTDAGEVSMDLPVKRIMKTEVITIRPNDHLESAARTMLKHKIGGIPILEEGRLVGIITESDIFKALWRILSFGKGGCGIIFEDYNDRSTELIEYLYLCKDRGCQVHGFLRYPRPKGGNMYFLSVEGGEIDALIDDIWSKSSQVISVGRN